MFLVIAMGCHGKTNKDIQAKKVYFHFWFQPLVSDSWTHGVRRMNYATQKTQCIQSTFRDIT